MRRLSAAALLCLVAVCASATPRDSVGERPTAVPVSQSVFFRHLDAGISVGSTGVGLNLATGITKNIRLRAGFDYFPRFAVPLSFGLEGYDGAGVTSDRFPTMQKYMKRLTGIDVDDRVEMDGKPMMFNFKFIVDVYPWVDKGWRVSAGFYWGGRKVAKAVNTMGEMPSLVAVNIYNHFYDYFMETDFYETPIYDDFYLDPFLVDEVRAELQESGQMGIHVGDFKDGKPYMMQPGTDGKVKATAYANAFRPYVGLGYTGPVGANKRLYFDVDCGMMMWGGSPDIITHDGVNLSEDLAHIKGKPGRYVDLLKTFKVYPVLSFTLSYKLF